MNTPPITLNNPPELSDEAAARMLDLLYELMTAFESHYAYQIRRYYQPESPPAYGLIPDFEDDLPYF